MPFENQMDELKRRKEKALMMGGEKKIAKQHAEGKYTARERIDKVLDTDSFYEVGMLNHSDMPGMEEKSPADSKVGGYGRINGRPVGIVAGDFTVLGATSSRVAARKEGDIRDTAARHGFPFIYLGEAGGARMPDIMGSGGLASYGGGRRNTFIDHMSRVRQTPMVTAVLGKCYGEPTWMACLSDFVVMVKGTAMGVSGPRIVSIALGENITDEELGGWELHSKVTAMADRAAENEDECMQIIRDFLSYMPSHNEELPPLAPVPEGSGEEMSTILNVLPEKRNRSYDMNQLLRCIVDKESLFPVKPLFGQTVITAFGRIEGKVIGIVANQPRFNSGAMDTDGIEKCMSFLCLCDSFNIPLVFIEDIPGFLVGREAERKRVEAHVMNFMNAVGLLTVPKINVIVRKAYGQAFWNMCGSGSGADSIVAWPTAEISFVDPVIAANVVYGATPPKSPEEQEERVRKMAEGTDPYGAAGLHYIHDVIDPRETRNHIVRILQQTQDLSKTKGISEHKLANWPTKF
ncbi:MAG: hypothetical protein M0P57_04520 [Syntrophales bacterium]|jgi:acetyl-CoA carboxylase carboxyltransferase component|nr:hypothetical protein [Syntrophales bacterium]MDY0043888.1 carboxyl transferase domain-containing protein [Syntrophales bacterium]